MSEQTAPKGLIPMDQLRSQVELAELQARLLQAKLRTVAAQQEMADLKTASKN